MAKILRPKPSPADKVKQIKKLPMDEKNVKDMNSINSYIAFTEGNKLRNRTRRTY